ncbi:MAG TPA: hypothetical protein VKN82_04980 [Desulfohalobiaceae bacterium]|nr:hypothetical protein [Desulfohalobiaceae bacterium]
MNGSQKKVASIVFFILFCVLTILCWCPIGYGGYGEVKKFLGMPQWAALALLISAILLVLEWIYLFWSDLAINDQDLPKMIADLKDFNSEKPQESH